MFAPKSMRPVDELISEFNEGKELSAEEERLVDSIVFEKTGERTKNFRQVSQRKAAKMTQVPEFVAANRAPSTPAMDIPIVSATVTKGPESGSKTLTKL